MLGEIAAELQSLGVRIRERPLQRKGGAGPADAVTLLIDGAPVNVPVNSPYVAASPYSLKRTNERRILFKGQREMLPVDFIPKPKFYGLAASDGTPYPKIALLHGNDCLATSVNQRCLYWNTKKRCRFCGIELSLESGQTVPLKPPRLVAEAAVSAKELDGATHVVLTTGTGRPPGGEISSLAACAAAVKKASGLPVHAQFQPPFDLEALHELKEAGVDTVGIHIECFDRDVLARVAPAKAEIGFKRYEQAWKTAVELFGPNQVSSFLIVGLGEKPSSVLSGSETLADLGVYPFVVPLRPIPGSLMGQALPPAPDLMKRLYEKAAAILSKKGLSASRNLAGCVRCGACSALPAFEEGMGKLICHPVRTASELAAAMEIRKEVFVLEQKMFVESDQDEEDSRSTHLVVETTEGIVGTVRVFPNGCDGGWIGGRLAVRKGYRSSGAGERLVQEAVRHVKRRGCTRFTAHIQEKNVPFFLRLGWAPAGPLECYCGRSHQLMEADLENNGK